MHVTVGCPKETMKDELRVGLIPSGVKNLLVQGAKKVLIEKSAGKRGGFPDRAYKDSGAEIVSREKVWRDATVVVKVKQPLPEEYPYLRDGRTVICFPHLADNPPLLREALRSGVTIIAYETIQLENGYTPILAEMSKIAGRKALFDCASLLMKHKGMMLGPNSEIMILGLGNAGAEIAELVVSTKPKFLYLLDKFPETFEHLKPRFYQHLSPYNLWFMKYDQDDPADQKILASILTHIDLFLVATYVSGELQTKTVPEWMEKCMEPGSVVADLSIDQGGAFRTSDHFKTKGRQIFKRGGIWHYCVPNIPGRVPMDSTPALTQATLPYILELAEKGFVRAALENPALAKGGLSARWGKQITVRPSRK